MAILDVVEYPAPVLLEIARVVRTDEINDELRQTLTDMAETMYAAPGVGLAAPQVGDGRRFIVIDPGEKDERGKYLYKMINPVIVETSVDFIYWDETCLSVPGLDVRVKRHNRIRLQWLNERAESTEAWFEGYHAVVVQHELDHLDGAVIADKASAFKRRRWMKKRAKELGGR